MEKAKYIDRVDTQDRDEYDNPIYVSTFYYTNSEVLPGAIPHEGYTGHEQKFIVKSTYPVKGLIVVKES